MKDKIFQIPGEISKIISMSNGSLKIYFNTQENITAESMKRLWDLLNKFGWMTVNVNQIEAEDIIDLPPLRKLDNKKSPSERLRNVLYRCWEKNNLGYETFDNYYLYMMDKICEHYKSQLD